MQSAPENNPDHMILLLLLLEYNLRVNQMMQSRTDFFHEHWRADPLLKRDGILIGQTLDALEALSPPIRLPEVREKYRISDIRLGASL